jgi:hypothetical protein
MILFGLQYGKVWVVWIHCTRESDSFGIRRAVPPSLLTLPVVNRETRDRESSGLANGELE